MNQLSPSGTCEGVPDFFSLISLKSCALSIFYITVTFLSSGIVEDVTATTGLSINVTRYTHDLLFARKDESDLPRSSKEPLY